MVLLGAGEWAAIVQACAAVVGLVGLAVYVRDTNRLRQAATAQLELLRQQVEAQRAERLRAVEPTLVLNVFAPTTLGTVVRNVGATVYDVEIEPDEPPGVSDHVAVALALPAWGPSDTTPTPIGVSPTSVSVSYTTLDRERRWQTYRVVRVASFPALELTASGAGRPRPDFPRWKDRFPVQAALESPEAKLPSLTE
jgi:hypothetical protein